MRVKLTQNSSNPGPVQSEASIKDGTSNTLGVAESLKTQKPFAKDSFDNFNVELGSLPCSVTGSFPKGALDGSSKEAGYGTETSQEKVVESVNVKYTFMDYTDDSE